MKFDWDDANREHIARHDVTPEEAEQAMRNNPFDLEAQDDTDDLTRYKQVGETDAGRILVILSTVRGNAIRILTAWDAPRAYKDFYHRHRLEDLWNNIK